jgi:hypothetical protein
VFLKCLKRIFGVFDCISALIPLDFYALPLLPEGQAAAAPRESFGFQRGLVAPAFGSGATAIAPLSLREIALKCSQIRSKLHLPAFRNTL